MMNLLTLTFLTVNIQPDYRGPSKQPRKNGLIYNLLLYKEIEIPSLKIISFVF